MLGIGISGHVIAEEMFIVLGSTIEGDVAEFTMKTHLVLIVHDRVGLMSLFDVFSHALMTDELRTALLTLNFHME